MDERIITEVREGAAPVNEQTLGRLNDILRKYKSGKSSLEKRVIAAEQWWKLRNESEERKTTAWDESFRCKSGWLHNVLQCKHADAMENYPEPIVLPREPGDKAEAQSLSDIVPLVLEANNFEEVYSEAMWQKLKTGTGIFKITWDQNKLNGLGDIEISNPDILNMFWEPGVKDIQDSKYIFHVELRDNETLESEYPQLKGKLSGSGMTISKYKYDDPVDDTDKSLVIDCYYKRLVDGRQVVHYVKYVNEVVLASTENDEYERENGGRIYGAEQENGGRPAQATRGDEGIDPYEGSGNLRVDGPGHPLLLLRNNSPCGDIDPYEGSGERRAQGTVAPTGEYRYGEGSGLYDDGLYPFVFDALFPIAGSPCGYGYVDLCQNSQTQIDLMDTAILKNMMAGVIPRYFSHGAGSINEEEFLDLTKPIVHTNSNLGADSVRLIDYKPLGIGYLKAYGNKVNELRETSGNTETATGTASHGVTSASGIAALQEASGKTSRDASRSAYRAYRKLITMVIERIRQFYDLPRQFRITGEMGQEKFISYDNSGIKPQPLGGIGDTDFGYKLPVFDIKIVAAKKTAFSRTAQNDLALQFYQLGFFNPEMAMPASACLEMMDFDGKDELMQKIEANNTIMQQLQQMQQTIQALLQRYDPQAAAMMDGTAPATAPMPTKQGGETATTDSTAEATITRNARDRAAEAVKI